MRSSWFLFAIVFVHPLEAQSSRVGVDRAALSGVLLDSLTGKPPQKTQICPTMRTGDTWIAAPCAKPDSMGHYRLDDLLLTTVNVWVSCQRVSGFGKTLATEAFELTAPKEIERNWLVSTIGCDLRPVRRVRRIFTGFWTAGFEESDFVPCPVDSWSLPSDSLPNFEAQGAWASLGKGVRVQKWPSNVPRDRWGNPTFYVKWRGTLEGPGHYGHMSMSAFSFVADSVIEIRAPRRGDCGRDKP